MCVCVCVCCVWVCMWVCMCVCVHACVCVQCVCSVCVNSYMYYTVIKMRRLTSCIYSKVGFHSKWCPSNYTQMQVTHFQYLYRVTALTSPNDVTEYFHKGKEQGVQWQLNRSYDLTCTPVSHVLQSRSCSI